MMPTRDGAVKTSCLIFFFQITNKSGVDFKIPVQIQNNKGTICLFLQMH